MRPLLVLAMLISFVAGVIVFIVRLGPGGSVWGLVLIAGGGACYWALASMTASERNALTVNAVAGYGPVPPRIVQKHLLQEATRDTLRGVVPGATATENYVVRCRMWAEEHDSNPDPLVDRG